MLFTGITSSLLPYSSWESARSHSSAARPKAKAKRNLSAMQLLAACQTAADLFAAELSAAELLPSLCCSCC